MKKMTPLQKAVVTMYTDMKEFAKDKEEAAAMVYQVNKPGHQFLNDFKRDVLKLRGVHWEARTGIQAVTLEEALYKQQASNKASLFLDKTLIFVGLPGLGKSEFVHALCREQCKRRQKEKYGMSSAIDPYGLMTKGGIMKDLGAIACYDHEMKSQLDKWLSPDNIKGLLYPHEAGHIPARYHVAIFPVMVPRLWAINYGRDDQGNVDKGGWFVRNNLPSLDLLVKEDGDALTAESIDDQAIARRAVIFCIDEYLFDHGHQGAIDRAAIDLWTADMENATPLE